MKRPRANRQEWVARVESWRRSGEPAEVFAVRHGWNPRTLTWWGGNQGRARRPADVKVPEVKLVELVREAKPAEREGSIEVVLRSGHRVHVRGAVDVATLSAVVRALEA